MGLDHLIVGYRMLVHNPTIGRPCLLQHVVRAQRFGKGLTSTLLPLARNPAAAPTDAVCPTTGSRILGNDVDEHGHRDPHRSEGKHTERPGHKELPTSVRAPANHKSRDRYRRQERREIDR